METEVGSFNGKEVVIADCTKCGKRRVLLVDGEDGYCSLCLGTDPYLASKFGIL